MTRLIVLFLITVLTLFAQATRQVALSWTASPSAGVTGYNVYRGTTTTGPFTLLTATPVTQMAYNDNAVTVGQTYTYQVTAVAAACTSTTPNSQPCGESPPATASTTVPPKPNVSATITVVVP